MYYTNYSRAVICVTALTVCSFLQPEGVWVMLELSPTVRAEEGAEPVCAWDNRLQTLYDEGLICDHSLQVFRQRISPQTVSGAPGTDAGDFEVFWIGTQARLPHTVLSRVTGLPREQTEESPYAVSRRCGEPAMKEMPA
jgi:hypothetical protein